MAHLAATGALTDPFTFDEEVGNPDLAVTVSRKDPNLEGASDHLGKGGATHALGTVEQQVPRGLIRQAENWPTRSARRVLQMNPQDLRPALAIRQGHGNQTVEPSGTGQCRINRVDPVCRPHDDHAMHVL